MKRSQQRITLRRGKYFQPMMCTTARLMEWNGLLRSSLTIHLPQVQLQEEQRVALRVAEAPVGLPGHRVEQRVAVPTQVVPVVEAQLVVGAELPPEELQAVEHLEAEPPAVERPAVEPLAGVRVVRQVVVPQEEVVAVREVRMVVGPLAAPLVEGLERTGAAVPLALALGAVAPG